MILVKLNTSKHIIVLSEKKTLALRVVLDKFSPFNNGLFRKHV